MTSIEEKEYVKEHKEKYPNLYREYFPKVEYEKVIKEFPTCNIVSYVPKSNICEICGKKLKNAHGVAIHKGKVHKEQLELLDVNGKVIGADLVIGKKPKNKKGLTFKQIQTKLQIIALEIIFKQAKNIQNDINDKKQVNFDKEGSLVLGKITKTLNQKPKSEKRTFYCLKHKTFHKYLFKGKPSKTYQKCLNSKDFYEFKEKLSNYQMFNINMKKSLKRGYNVKSHKKTTGSRKQ